MKQTQAFLSTYTADVSGVCSALFELGGMTVMHDASGCNSTYHTHDEPRWYDMDSLVFISGLSELEAVMGDDEKLITDIVDAARQLHPRFIALAGTPIPMITGCDLPAIAREVAGRTNIPSFAVPSNGIRTYVAGAGQALRLYAERFITSRPDKRKNAVNILGATPLDFSVNGCVQSMARRLEEADFTLQSVFAMGSCIEAIDEAGAAEVNLVISSVGLPAAKYLQAQFGTPYVIGAPFGDFFSPYVFDALRASIRTGENTRVLGTCSPDAPDTVIVGESVTAKSLAAALAVGYGIRARVICPVEAPDGVLGACDLQLENEEEIEEALRGARRVIADPLYRRIVPAKSEFYLLPHEAFSGRIYRRQIPNLAERV